VSVERVDALSVVHCTGLCRLRPAACCTGLCSVRPAACCIGLCGARPEASKRRRPGGSGDGKLVSTLGGGGDALPVLVGDGIAVVGGLGDGCRVEVLKVVSVGKRSVTAETAASGTTSREVIVASVGSGGELGAEEPRLVLRLVMVAISAAMAAVSD
jgi:hypothetical protein